MGNQGGKKKVTSRVAGRFHSIHSFIIMHHHLSAFSSGRSGISDRIEIKSFCSCGRVVHATATSEDLEFRIDPFVRPPRSRSNRSFLSVLHFHPSNFCHSGDHCGLTHLKKKAEWKSVFLSPN